MAYYYDGDGFLTDELTEDIPDKAIKLTDDYYQSLMDGQANGLQIVKDKSGRPMLTEQPESDVHKWDGEKWVISDDDMIRVLAEKKEKIIAKINAKLEAVLDAGCYVSAIDKVVDTSSKGLSDLRAMATDFELNGGAGERVLICKDYTVKFVNHETFKAVWSAAWAFKSAVEETAVMHVNCAMARDDPASYDYSDYWDGLGA